MADVDQLHFLVCRRPAPDDRPGVFRRRAVHGVWRRVPGRHVRDEQGRLMVPVPVRLHPERNGRLHGKVDNRKK